MSVVRDGDDPASRARLDSARRMQDTADAVTRKHLVEMASTTEGERGLQKRLDAATDPEERAYWEKLRDEGRQLRADNVARGRANAAAKLVVSVNGARYGLDEAQTEAVWKRTLSSVRGRDDDDAFVPAKKWAQFVESQDAELDKDEAMTETQFGRARRNLRTAAKTPPTRYIANAAWEFSNRVERAAAALERQEHLGAGMRGVSVTEYAERVDAYRHQYMELPEKRRPAPPADWVQGVTTKDRMARSMPDDPATMWAHYRAQSDPDAFPDADRSFVSVDIETAGPKGSSGFKPENGQIIEVGMVAYNDRGVEVGSYSTLVKPKPAPYGTGATNIHHIEMEDVKDAPSWEQVAPEVAARLRGHSMLAQNSPFEDNWLTHHMAQAGDQNWRPRETLDTLRIAQQHMGNEERHTLGRICERVGVPYGEGGNGADGQAHRAEHDARVAARAWFGMRERIEQTYRSDPKRRSLPQPASRPMRKTQPTRSTPKGRPGDDTKWTRPTPAGSPKSQPSAPEQEMAGAR